MVHTVTKEKLNNILTQFFFTGIISSNLNEITIKTKNNFSNFVVI